MNKISIDSAYEYYKKATSIVESCCTNEELAKGKHPRKIDIGDMVLPYGCGKLKIKGPAIIEFKVHLSSFIGRLVDRKNKCFPEYNLYIIYLHSQIPKEYITKLSSDSTHFIDAQKIFSRSISELISEAPFNDAPPILNGFRTLFIGAGVSKSAGLPNWEELLANIIQNIADDTKRSLANGIKDKNEIIRAQKLFTIIAPENNRNTQKVHNVIHKALWGNCTNKSIKSPLVDSIVNAISQKEINAIVTYNYDDVIESELKKREIDYSQIIEGEEVMDRIGIPILHVHGYIPRKPGNELPHLVLDESSYHRMYNDSYMWANVEQLHYMRNSHCIFVGLSMQDPNLRRLLELANNKAIDGILRDTKHCVFLQRKEHGKTGDEIELTRKIMSRLGLHVIWYDEHCEIPSLLSKLLSSKVNGLID